MQPVAVIRDRWNIAALHIASRQEIFHFGPMKGTNNIGEFLAIVHGLALLKKKGFDMPIYVTARMPSAGCDRRSARPNSPNPGNRRTVFIDRTGRKMVAGKYVYHSYPEMGNERMGRNSGRLRQKIKEHKYQS
jgi:hypothetical protein